ncbi:MAG: multidrug effflux MFS transporter [Devosia sp.]|nr:multidrug effflux MFS transporter [Devosia sp.]
MTAPRHFRRAIGRVEFIALVAALMGLNAIAIDIMLPALPAMGATLGLVHENERQLVISAYLVGFGTMQLLIGPIADRFGRRVPLLIGIAVYVACALLAPLAPNLAVLLALRALQGVGAAGTRVLGQAIVRDRHAGTEMAEVLSLANMAFLVLPVISPALGQAILVIGHWQDIFRLMALLGVVMAGWVWFRLPETLAPEHRRPLQFGSLVQGFRIVLAERAALAYGLASMFMLGALFGFINSAQQIFVEVYGLGTLFPAAFAAVAGLQSAAAFANARLVRRLGARRITRLAAFGYAGVGAVMAATSLFGDLPFAGFFTLLLCIMCLFTWANSNMNALSMGPLGQVAGTASSAFGFIQTVGGTLLGMLVGQAYDGTTRPISFGYLLMGLLALVAVQVAEHGRLFGRQPQPRNG